MSDKFEKPIVRPMQGNMPLLSLEERDKRWRNVREQMALNGLDCLIVWSREAKGSCGFANFRYLTQIPYGGFLIFPLEGEPIVYIDEGPYIYYQFEAIQNWIKEVHHIEEANIARTIKELGFEKGNIGVTGFGGFTYRWEWETLPYSFSYVVRDLSQAKIIDASGIFSMLRMIKSAEEIKFMEKASELADLMLEAMVKSARPGIREYEIYANMIHASLSNGGELAHIFLDSGPRSLLHGRCAPFSSRKLEKGDMVMAEIHSNYGGYFGGIERSISLGEPRKEYKEIYKVQEECLYAAISMLKAGVPLTDIERAMRRPAEESGMQYMENGIHGHGLASPEYPIFFLGGRQGFFQEAGAAKVPPGLIRENMIIVPSIVMFNPNWDKNSGLMLGELVLTGKGEARRLCKSPIELIVA